MKSAKEIKKEIAGIHKETGFKIDTLEGARGYLKSVGIDPDEEAERGLKMIEQLKLKSNQ